MSSTTPPGNPGNPARTSPSETSILARRIVGLPRHVRGKQNLEKSFSQGNNAPVLNHFRSLVASPATPNTPTPVPTLGSGYNSIASSFIPPHLCASTTPERSFSFFSASSLSPPDSPYPSTPAVSPFDADPSVAEDSQNDADPFEILPRTVDEVKKARGVAVLAVPLKDDSQRVDFQESPPPLRSTEGTVRPTKTSADIPGLGRSASDLEKPFTRGASLSFHDPPRQYKLAQKKDTKSNSGTPSAVFVLRSSPQIIEEESSDEEFEPEDRGDDDKTTHSFPFEDSKMDELVSMMASLSLGTGLNIACPIITPTRARARVSSFVPARTPVSSPVAMFRPVVAHPSTAQHAIPMEVDEDVPDRTVANKSATYPQEIAEAVPMDGVVFYPEVKDMEMMDAFATNPGAAPFISPAREPTSTGSASFCPRPVFGTTWDPKSTPNQGQGSVFGAPTSPSRLSHVPRRTVFDFLCQSPKATVFPGTTVSPAGSHGQFVNVDSCAL